MSWGLPWSHELIYYLSFFLSVSLYTCMYVCLHKLILLSLRSSEVYLARFWILLRTFIYFLLILPLELMSIQLSPTVFWKHISCLALARFTAREKSCLRMIHASSLTHIWFRWYLRETELQTAFAGMKTVEAVKIEMNISCMREEHEFWNRLGVECYQLHCVPTEFIRWSPNVTILETGFLGGNWV